MVTNAKQNMKAGSKIRQPRAGGSIGVAAGWGAGFTPWWHVRLVPKMVNKVNAINIQEGQV